jgi:hypothetical protein
MPGAYGQRSPSRTYFSIPLDLADGQRLGDLKIQLWKYASISGTVVDEAGDPVVGLTLRVMRRTITGGRLRISSGGNICQTDDRGIYRCADLAPGDYLMVIASSQSTLPAAFDDAYRQAMLDGTINEKRQLWSVSGVDTGGVTNGVKAGGFLMAPSGQNGSLISGLSLVNPLAGANARPTVYETVFYPSTPLISRATVIHLSSGEDRGNIDFQLHPVPTVRLSGSVTGPDGPAAFIGLNLTRADIDDAVMLGGFESATAATDGAGAFTFLGITPGQYRLRAIRTPVRPPSRSSTTTVISAGSTTITSSSGPSIPSPVPAGHTLTVDVPVTVGDTDVAGVNVTLAPGVRFTGRLKFEGAATAPDADRIQRTSLTIDPLEGRSSWPISTFTILRGQFDAEGRLSTYEIPPGRYFLRIGGFPGWTFKSALWKGQDVSVVPLDVTGTETPDITIVFTDTPTVLAGTVRDATGAGDPQTFVLVFPADPKLWADEGPGSRVLRSTPSSGSGAYTFAGLPPGEYYVAAVPTDRADNWQDPDFLRALAPRATRLTLGDADHKTQDLRTVVIGQTGGGR